MKLLGTVGAPIDDALGGGGAAATPGEAFLAGYRAALHALVPSLPPGRAVCLCATEDGGAHPRAIRTTLTSEDAGFRVRGAKRWVTGGTLADELLVVASVGEDATGKNRLRVVRIDAHASGVHIEEMPPAPFVPEVPHATVRLEDVRVEAPAVLPGDGYDGYLKPFRTVEDIHVIGAILAWVLAVGERGAWPASALEPLWGVLVGVRALATEDPAAAETHVALTGILALGRLALEATRPHWDMIDPATRSLWERDRVLLDVASKARAQRAETAWRKLRDR